MVIVDVRSALEYRRGHVPGAVHLPFWAAAFRPLPHAGLVGANRRLLRPRPACLDRASAVSMARHVKRVPARRPHGRVAARRARRAVRKLIVMAASPLPRLRRLCLALPEAHEVMAWGEPTFRVRNKMFATFASAAKHHGRGRHAAWVKALPVNQDLLVRSAPRRVFVPPYVGPSGWVGLYLDDVADWDEIQRLCGRGIVGRAKAACRAGGAGVAGRAKRGGQV